VYPVFYCFFFNFNTYRQPSSYVSLPCVLINILSSAGWEKAEAEAEALKIQLETVTLNKLSSDERAAHLDSALKECMKQIRNVKEESEQKLHDVVFAKTKQWEKVKSEFESRISEFEQEFLRANAENDALSRSLHERSNLIMKISEEKSQVEAEIELLKNNIQSCEREINSLKYELHVVAKELEIRNEEKNMSVRSADVANRQHAEGVKKITKLEAECQRLRGLVRKKLPGPAALAQMKMEVESMGREYGEPRIRRPVTPAMENHIHQMQKENEFLTSRLLAMDEETKMLKEALSKKNTELQVTRNTCAKTASKLRGMEVQLLTVNQQRGANGHTSNASNIEVHFDGDSNPPSLTSMSEDGDDASMSESWATALMSELSNFKKKENGRGSIGSNNNNNNNGTTMATQSEGSTHLELMDDFLEMEKLACESTTNGNDDVSESNSKHENGERNHNPSARTSASCSTGPESPISNLRLRIVSLLDSQVTEGDIDKVIESIKSVLKEVQVEFQGSPGNNGLHNTEKDLKTALCQILDFVTSLGKEATEIHGRSSENFQTLCAKIEEFSASVDKAFDADRGLYDLILALSGVLSETNNMNCSTTTIEGENSGLDCVDKVTLLENKVAPQDEPSPDMEELKLEKKTLEEELARCNEKLESTELKFAQMEKWLGEVRSKLADSEKANGLMDTQLKCMAESYKTLETCKLELEGEINLLKEKIEALNEELVKERKLHEEDIVKCKELQEQCKELQEQLERYVSES
jgi:chromosome segregation ATPase